jgi:hypothetical protein
MSFAGAEKLIPNRAEFKLTVERLKEWEWYNRFVDQNPDIQARWEQHKIYEILKNDTREIKA